MKYLKKQIYKYDIIINFLIIFLCVFSFILGGKLHENNNLVRQLIAGVSIGIAAFVILYSRDNLIKKQKNYEKGLKGENYMKDRIENDLRGMKYYFFNNVKNKNGGDIDLVLVCDHKVYCIENKNITGRVTYDGSSDKLLVNNFEKNYLRQVRSNALEIKEKIENKGIKIDFVTPVLVVMGNCVLDNVPEEVRGARIYYPNKFIDYIKKQITSTNINVDAEAVYKILKNN